MQHGTIFGRFLFHNIVGLQYSATGFRDHNLRLDTGRRVSSISETRVADRTTGLFDVLKFNTTLLVT